MAQNDPARMQAAAARAAERERKERQRVVEAQEKERKRRYVEVRMAGVAAGNARLDRQVHELETLLATALGTDAWVDFEFLKRPMAVEPFDPGALGAVEPLPNREYFMPAPLYGLQRFMPGAKDRHGAALAEGERRYEEAVRERDDRETSRRERIKELKTAYDARVAAALEARRQQHAEIDDLRVSFEAGDPEAVVRYFDIVLKGSSCPESFTRRFRLAYVPESRQLVIEFELSPVTVVPAIKAYNYVKSRDEVTETARPAAQVKSLYGGVIAQSALRTLYEVFQADRIGHIESVVFNGLLDTVDRSTGRPIRPCLVTVRTTKHAFNELDLSNVEPAACLKHLGANVSRSPMELLPVRPVLEFDMVDKRFVQEDDVLSGLDQRPNLMELTPGEFENLITNLFTRMGLDTKQTQPSRDGGVDCVAFDCRPIFGGKVVIQAKRYKGTVGVSAVRDLYGTVHNEGASKGILVATSGYGRASFEFAKGKPLELLDGRHLLFLLEQHTGVVARIEPPDDWQDPASAALA